MPETILDDTPRDTFANFAAALGTSFDLPGADGTARLTLVEAAPSAPADGARQPFSLLFREPSRRVLPQGIWHMRHATLGELDLFIVPIAQDQDGTTYQAIFN